MSKPTISPLPSKFGVGFTAQSPLPAEEMAGYDYRPTGRYHNYHATPWRWRWPYPMRSNVEHNYVIDAFSPNLNKELHVGHLRNLAIARGLYGLLQHDRSTKFVSLLGCSLGVKKAALDGWRHWKRFLGLTFWEDYYDLVLPQDVVQTHPSHEKQPANETGWPEVWDGPNGEVIVVRSDGRRLYAYYDLVFAQEVGPTHYVTGHEQREHFKSLGFADKHLPMGLVLGADNKKLKSRTGDAITAAEAMQLVSEQLRDAADFQRPMLSWNILSWNFLHAARGTDLRFEPERWCNPDAPGMYITYTFARVLSAASGTFGPERLYLPPSAEEFENCGLLSEEDVELLGLADQKEYYSQRAIEIMDPSPLANFAYDLARQLSIRYEQERIRDGRPAYAVAIRHALYCLRWCMSAIGMFPIAKV